MDGFQFVDSSIRLVFALAVGLSVFNLSVGFAQIAPETRRADPLAYMFVPGLLGGWVVKICFFLLTAQSRLDAQVQSTQLFYAAVAQAVVALVLVSWLVLTSTEEQRPNYA